jgi:predicted TIM-barrel fold metal-dependent hydrolase
MAGHGLVATIEATSDHLGVVTRLTRELPDLKVLLDHFGWPTDLSDAGRRIHLDRLAELEARPNVATRLDAIGTMFGAWTAERVGPWLRAIVALFGPDRCMLGSDLPIERLRCGFDPCTAPMTRSSLGTHRATARCCCAATAEQWYGTG